MLVLTRYPRQRIIFSGGPLSSPITVEVVDVQQGIRVRIGVEAPAEIRVDREEIFVKRQEDQGNGEPL